jgi:hypothetical protein
MMDLPKQNNNLETGKLVLLKQTCDNSYLELPPSRRKICNQMKFAKKVVVVLSTGIVQERLSLLSHVKSVECLTI